MNSSSDKKENKIFLIKKEIKKWNSCKVIYEEGLPNMWGNAQIFPHIWGGRYSSKTLQLLHFEFHIYEENLIFFFINVLYLFPFRLYTPVPNWSSITLPNWTIPLHNRAIPLATWDTSFPNWAKLYPLLNWSPPPPLTEQPLPYLLSSFPSWKFKEKFKIKLPPILDVKKDST